MKSLTRFALVLWTAASMIVSPVYAQAQSTAPQQNQQTQSQQQTPPPKPAQEQMKPPTPAQPPNIVEMATAPGQGPAEPISQKHLSVGANYSKGKHWFPDIFDQYWPTHVPAPKLTNAPKLGQLINNGQLMLSLDDAIALALEDNLDIRVQQYQTWVSQTALLKAESGGIPQAGASQAVTLGSAPLVAFDPELTMQASWNQALSPVNNAFTTGAGTLTVPLSASHYNDYKVSYAQGFHTGTSLSVTWDNSRNSSNFTSFVFNPWVQSSLTATLTQPLLNGCCVFQTTRFIITARNDTLIADATFRTSVITDITQTENDYWELVFDREFVKVEQQAVAASQKLYNDNKRQLQIGTMAPLDVVTAQSALATDQQNLVAAQTNVLLQQTKLLNDITKDPLAGNLKDVEIVPTTPIETPQPVDTPIDQLMSEAWQNVPAMTIDRLTLTNDNIAVRATANSLRPSLNLFLQYETLGLAGNHTTVTATPLTFAADPTEPIVDASGAQSAPPLFLGFPTSFGPQTVNVMASGVGTSEHDMIAGKYPQYTAGITLGLPLRNRSAESDNARALLDERQSEVLYQKDKNTVYVNVRQSLIQMEQNRAAITAAAEATKLAQESYVDEEKRFQLGVSNSYQVVLKQRDLSNAESTELRDRINLIEAETLFNEAMGRTLQANDITIADALHGGIMGVPNIPGTPDTAAADSYPRNRWSGDRK